MLTITRSASSAARPTRLPCPACRLPIVGTNATRSPPCRQAARCARSSLGPATDSMLIPRDFPEQHSHCSFAPRSEAVLGGGILARLHGLRVGLHGFERAVVPGHEILRELRLAAGGDVEHVVQHEDLAVR